MKLRGYELGDERRFTPRADFAADYRAAGSVLPPGPKMTVVDEAGAVVGVAGFAGLQGDGTAYCAWALLSPLANRQWVALARKARTVCVWAAAFMAGGRARIYATPACGAHEDAAMRTLAYIGFRPSPDDAGVWKWMGGR